jgi:hypothetical protein
MRSGADSVRQRIWSVGANYCTVPLFKIESLIIFIAVKHLNLVFNIFALVFGALATQSCQDTAGFIQRGDPNESRKYYDSHFSQVGNNKAYNRASSQQQSR